MILAQLCQLECLISSLLGLPIVLSFCWSDSGGIFNFLFHILNHFEVWNNWRIAFEVGQNIILNVLKNLVRLLSLPFAGCILGKIPNCHRFWILTSKMTKLNILLYLDGRLACTILLLPFDSFHTHFMQFYLCVSAQFPR